HRIKHCWIFGPTTDNFKTVKRSHAEQAWLSYVQSLKITHPIINLAGSLTVFSVVNYSSGIVTALPRALQRQSVSVKTADTISYIQEPEGESVV
ncbi:MAG: hypothetical protein K2O13_00675, partial [Lachnospiraceae bacterium]|nr:hypothetical protein [Lachnospiraceae bacterium]